MSRCNGELSGGIHPACEDALFLVSVLGHYRMLMEGRVDETAELLNLRLDLPCLRSCLVVDKRRRSHAGKSSEDAVTEVA